jgi:DNA modification methylase
MTKLQEINDRYSIFNADCVELARELPSDSIHYSITSIPFAQLFVYSNSPRDMGNCKNRTEFYEHYKFLVKEWLRVMMPGRIVSIHCMNLPTSKVNDGYIGLLDFRGEIIRIMQEAGFIYHSEVCIWKCPVIAVTRTKALGLLHKQLKKDSSMSRQGIADYLVSFRKPGENPEKITHTNESFPVPIWQRYASPVWTDINQSFTLNEKSAKDHDDEKHICPLQLEVIERGIQLWSNPNDVVYDPFGGIGSTGYVALRMGRRTLMTELKESYYRQMDLNMKQAIIEGNIQPSLFDGL